QAEPRPAAVPVLPPVPAGCRRADRQRRGRHPGVREIPGDLVQLALRGRLEHGIKSLVELLQGEPALRVVLPQARGRCLAVGVPYAKVGSGRHMILRANSRQVTSSKTIYRVVPVGKL